ncbi:MAG: HNH endonuclease signature motif containing protein, partial [Myxococcota bacterium]
IGDWSRERLGVGARTLREWARVWRALGELPRLRGAVLSGEVSWTVARRVVAVATPETDEACLASVRGRTVRAVEAMLAALARGEPAADEGEDGRARVHVPCAPEVVGRWPVAVELARRVAGEALPLWAGAEAVAAEAASALGPAAVEGRIASGAPERARLARRGRESEPTEHGLRHVVWPWLRWSSGPGETEDVDSLARSLETCGPRELDRRFRAAVAFLQSLDLELGRLLRQVLERRLHRELGFESFERYVLERLDLSRRTARRLVRLARMERSAPKVADAFRSGAITAFQAEVLLRVPRRETPAWLARARRVTLRRLEDDVPSGRGTAIAFHAPADVAEFFLDVLRRVQRRLGVGTSPGRALEVMLDHAIATWLAEGRRFRDYADFERDGWRCTVPGCTARRNLESHHLRFRSAGGPDEPWNRTTLCAFHHRRGVHEGRVRIRGHAPDRLVFALGTRPGERPWLRFRSGDVLYPSSPSSGWDQRSPGKRA